MATLYERVLHHFNVRTCTGLLIVLGLAIGGGWFWAEYPTAKAAVGKWWYAYDLHTQSAADLSRQASEALADRRIDEGMRLHAQALEHYRKLHAYGYAEGSMGLGLAYCHGYGVKQRRDLGWAYLREAANRQPSFEEFLTDERYCLGVSRQKAPK